MRPKFSRVFFGVVASAVLAAATPCQAGPIIDWLRSWHAPKPVQAGCGAAPYAANYPYAAQYPYGANYPYGTNYPYGAQYPYASQYPAGANYPTTALYPHAASGAYQPALQTAYPPTTAYRPAMLPNSAYAPVTAYSPGTAYAPTMAFAPGTAYAAGAGACPTCQRPVVSNYAPYTNYRSSWMRVPVTLYRPVTVVDPTSGQPVTVMQPCTTSSWQVQRAPALVQRPFVQAYAPLPVSGCATCGPGAGCATVPSATPYYVPPAGATGAFPPAIIYSTPAGPAAPPGYPSNIVPGATEPANTRPQLDPSGLQFRTNPGPANYPPIDSRSNGTAPFHNSVPFGSSAPSSNYSVPFNGGASSHNGATNHGATNHNAPSSHPPAISTSPSSVSTPPIAAPKQELRMQPAPDPEADRFKSNEPSIPPLLTPHSRSASLPVRPALMIAPATLQTDVQPPRPIMRMNRPENRAPVEVLDDSGWKAVK